MPKKIQKQSRLKKALKQPKAKPVKLITHRIDATDQILGRLATSICNTLRGKNKPNFQAYLNMGDKVIVYNAAKIKVTGNKMSQKKYYSHSGYIGNLKTTTMSEIYRRNPSEILKRAIYGMLPKNKLRNLWIRNLVIINGVENGKTS